MIAADTSSLIAYLQNAHGGDVETIDKAIDEETLLLPPVVVTELLSTPSVPTLLASLLLKLPLMELTEGYWHRAAQTRAKILKHKLKANLADALIAQSCLDHDVALITRDTDFRHYAKHCGLRLA